MWIAKKVGRIVGANEPSIPEVYSILMIRPVVASLDSLSFLTNSSVSLESLNWTITLISPYFSSSILIMVKSPSSVYFLMISLMPSSVRSFVPNTISTWFVGFSFHCAMRVWFLGILTTVSLVTSSFFSLNHPTNLYPVLLGVGRVP